MTTTAERLEHAFEDKPGLAGWIGTVDHKRLGKRYIATAFAFFLVGGIEALLIRTQLIVPENDLVGPGAFNELFTIHGTTMIFLFATPIMTGFAVYLVPLMIGTRDMAFPRLNAFTYYVFLLSGIFLYASFLSGDVPYGGWFNYPPLSDRVYAPGLNIDFYNLGIILLGISTTGAGINAIVTVFKLRAPGMSLGRLPVFVWTALAQGLIVVFALPPLTLAATLLTLDRKLGTTFYLPAAGGDPLLWQHLFWLFGHPEVYLVFIPATGLISMIIPTFARRSLAGYTWVVAATIATATISFGVWVHHMYAVGLPAVTLGYFAAASLVITIPSGVQMFAWLVTIARGRLVWSTAFRFAAAFLFIFTLGGITGVMVSVAPFDWQVTDSYFIVAHLHYVMAGGALIFPVLAALHFWIPKFYGRMLDERLGHLSFWLVFIGFNLTFFPQHLLGFFGMPRRIYTYQPGLGWDGYNLLSSVGAYVLGLGILVFLVDFVRSMRSGPLAPANPWGGGTLEWATSSPPEHYNFEQIPVVSSREPLWEEPEEIERPQPLAGRRMLATAGVDAVGEQPVPVSTASYWPPAAALALTVAFAGVLVEVLPLIGVGLGALVLALLLWVRPMLIGEEQTT